MCPLVSLFIGKKKATQIMLWISLEEGWEGPQTRYVPKLRKRESTKKGDFNERNTGRGSAGFHWLLSEKCINS